MIIISWIVLMGFHAKKSYFPHAQIKDTSSLSHTISSGEEWMSIYMSGKKIGFVNSSIQEMKDGYSINEDVNMLMSLMGYPRELKITTRADVDKGFILKSFESRISSGITSYTIKGYIKQERMHLVISSGEYKGEKIIEIKEVPFISSNMKFFMLTKGLKEGMRFEFPFFDPLTHAKTDLVAEVGKKEIIEIEGVKISAFKIKESFLGFETYVWVDENGKVLKEESPLGIVMISEPKERAIAKDDKSGFIPDLILASSIETNIKIERPAEVNFMRVKLSKADVSFIPYSPDRQIFKGDIIEIKKENLQDIKSHNIPYKFKEMEEFLQSTTFIQSKNEKIVEQARTIIGNEKDALKATELIMSWVYSNVEKKPVISIPSAIDVLVRKEGDCNEHAVLFIALARAAGIPARMVAGIVYSQGRFYYHAWSEIYIGRWISVDSILNQLPADATHLKLVEGEVDKQVEIARVIGKIKVEILEFK